MTSISYLIGRSIDSRQRLLKDKMTSSRDDSILHLVSTKGRVMELEADPVFWLQRRINTLTGLIHQVFEDNIRIDKYSVRYPIDDALRSLLIKKIMDQRRKEPDGLAYFNRFFKDRDPDKNPPGIYRAIAGFFSKLVKNNYQDRLAQDLAGKIIRLEDRTPGMGEERYALESDLTWLFGDYEEIKIEVNGYDGDDIFSSVRLFLKGGNVPDILNKTDVLVLDGFTHLTRIEEDILFYFCQQVEQVWWLIDYDGGARDPLREFKEASGLGSVNSKKVGGQFSDNQAGGYEAYRIFQPIVSLIERLEECDFKYHIERSHERTLPNPLAGGIFFDGKVNGRNYSSLKVRSFPNRESEVRAIAGEIKRIIREEGIDPSKDLLGKIRVIFPDLNDYSSIISEIFNECGIPFSLTKGLPLISHPLSNVFRYIFEVPLNRFRRDDIFRLFSSDLIREEFKKTTCMETVLSKIRGEYLLKGDTLEDLDDFLKMSSGDEISTALDIHKLDRLARACGLDNLDNMFSGSEDSCILWVREYFQEKCFNKPYEEGTFRKEYYSFITQSGLLENKLGAFRDLIKCKNPYEIEEIFLTILEDMGFPKNIVDMSSSLNADNHGTGAIMVKRDIKAYSILKDLIQASQRESRIAQELFAIKGGYDLLSRFYSIFISRLSNAYLLDERNPNVVRISQWLETRGRAFDCIFAGGLTADRFPLRDEADFILPDSPNKIFRILDPVDQSRHLFSHVIKNYREKLYLSFPRYSEEKALSPSPVLKDMESMIKTSDQLSPEPINLEEIFEWPGNPYYTSKEELLNAFIVKGQIKPLELTNLSHLTGIVLKPETQIDDLLRRINADRSRRATDGLYEHDGIVGTSQRFKEYLDASKKSYSPSQMDTLANCPMRYQFERIFELRPRQEIGLEVSPKDMGEHIHNVLSIFFRRLKDGEKNVSDIGLNTAFPLALEVAESYFSRYPFLEKFDLFLQQKREFLAGLDQEPVPDKAHEREGIFAQLLRFEVKGFQDRRPKGLEYFFGRKEENPVFIGKTKIHGYIDRFDSDKADNDLVYVYDYKSGNIPPSSMIKKGLSFQLPAYMRALKSELGFKKIFAGFYSLKRGLLLDEKPLKEIITDNFGEKRGFDIKGVSLIDDFVDDLLEILEKGCFHHSTDEVKCYHCDFRYACHKEVRRINSLIDSGADPHIYSGRKNLDRWKKVDSFRKELRSIISSMNKAFELKTESAREKHFENVVNFRNTLIKDRHTLPFYSDYIDEIIMELEDFEKRYKSDHE